jgi:UDP-N-acetylglucosamine 2-epimerase (non-hydrolysing)
MSKPIKNILIVFGTRPEAIKMAPVINEFKNHPDEFNTIVCVTGQHRHMLDQVLDLFGIVPDFDFAIMNTNQDLYDITSKVLLKIREIIKIISPDLILVHGDTTTSFSTALAGFYCQIPVAHIEAGLRTYNIYSPWPEEMNRSLTSRIATWHFAPTEINKKNLLKENIKDYQIIVTGNTVIDALKWVTLNINNREKIILDKILMNEGYDVMRLNENRKLILITAHRRENFNEGIHNICNAIKNLSEKFSNVDFVYPVHLNPNIINPVKQILGNKSQNNNIFLLSPLEYLSFIYLINKSYFILTDSGGIQEEASGLGKPVLVMRNTTERPEALKAGAIKLIGTKQSKIEDAVSKLLENQDIYLSMAKTNNIYGDGNASKKIVSFIRTIYN